MRRPTVLIVGGFMTLPANYWPLRRRLLRRGATAVDIAPIWPIDWGLAGVIGFGPIMTRTRRAIIETYRAAGQPITVVAHSGGGLVARMAMSSAPFHGRRGGVGEAVACLVTLGTPHKLAALPNRYRHAGHEASAFLDRESPGAFFAPRTGYLSVGSTYPMAAFPGLLGKAAREVFSVIVGENTDGLGDGIVPFSAVHLDDAHHLTFDDARHGHIGANWYGADTIVDRWWPKAVELWQTALEARTKGEPAKGPKPLRAKESKAPIAAAEEPAGAHLATASKRARSGSPRAVPH